MSPRRDLLRPVAADGPAIVDGDSPPGCGAGQAHWVLGGPVDMITSP